MRLESKFSLPVHLSIWKAAEFANREAGKNLTFGIYYGALFILALYNLFLFFSVRDLSYLYYFLYAASIGIYQSFMDGFSVLFLTSNIVWFNFRLVTSIYLAGGSWILFVKEFLRIKNYSKAIDMFYKILIGIFIFGAISEIISPRIGILLSAPIWFPALIINIAAGVYCMRKGNVDARIYLIATFVFILGGSLRMLRVIGIEQESLLTESAMQIGILAEMTILSFALGNRINRIRQETEIEKAMIRSKIASDLHDEIGSNLSSISVASQMIKRSSNLEENEKRQLEDITATAKETSDSIRDIIWFINPEHDKSDDMIWRMRDTAAKLLQGIDFTFDVMESKVFKSKDLQFRRNFFLIFKEILNNVVKHSKASCVKIKLEDNSKEFRLEVVDNGVGFDEKNIDPRHGEGIKNLKKRAIEIGCDLKISGEVGKGTMVELRMRT